MGPPKFLTKSEFIGVCRMRSIRGCFVHISLIRTQNHVLFFYGLLVLQGIFYQNFKKFPNLLNRSSKFQFRKNSLKHV